MMTTQNPELSTGSQNASEISPGDQVLSIIAEVESQLERIRNAQTSHSEEIASIEQRTRAIEAAEQGLQAARQDLQQQRQTLDEQMEAFNRRQAEAAAELEQHRREKAEVEQTRDETSRRLEEVSRREQQILQAQTAIKAAGDELARLRTELESQRNGIAEGRRRLEEEQAAVESARAELAAKLSREATELTQARESLEAMTARVEKAETNVGELIQKIEHMQEEISRGQSDTQSLRAQLEKSETESLQMVEQAEKQRDAATAQLQESQHRLQELERSAEASVREATRAKEALAQREATLAETNEKLRLAGGKLAQFGEALQKQTQELQNGAAAVIECQQLRRTVERMQETIRQKEQELERAREGGPAVDGGTLDGLQTELVRLRHELSQRQQGIEELKERSAQQAVEAEERFQQSVQRYEEQIKALQNKAQGSRNDSGAAANLQEKARLIQEVAGHLKRRKQRLQRVRSLLRKSAKAGAKAAATSEASSRQLREIQEKKDALLEVQKCLAASEQQMMRRWARPRAMAMIGWLLVLTGIIATGSWFGAGMWRPPTVAASVVVEAKGRAGQTPSGDDLQSWQSAHESMVRDPLFVASVARRMGDRQIRAYADATRLEVFLKDNLTLDSDRPGVLRLTLRGEDGSEAMTLLDTVVTSLTTESAKSASRRPDGLKSVVAGEKAAAGRVQYASLNDSPVKDERLLYAAILFGVGMSVVLLAWIGAYQLLLRSKRVFDKDMGLVEDGTTIALN